ncbi:hypothetical protein CKQ90_18535, partial [Klebsiella pneumoniae]
MTYAVEFQNVSRLYGDVRAVDGVSIGIRDGEFFSMLGPSGSGKTTCLRLIAGFEQLSGGTIHIFGQPASELPPWQRDVNTVFQDYALFPHMSILDNVAYGLRDGEFFSMLGPSGSGKTTCLRLIAGFEQLSGG